MSNEELAKLVQSNARTIQGMLDTMLEDRLERSERNQRLDATISRMDEAISRLTVLNQGVINLLSSLDEDRPTIFRKLSTIENKLDRLLEQGNRENSGN